MSPSLLDPGIYPEIDRDRYDSIERINFSILKHMRKSAAHCRHAMITKGTDTDAKKVGRVVHRAAFEPERFLNSIAVWDGDARRGKDWEAFKVRNAGRELLTENEYARCMAIQKAVNDDEVARRFVNSGRGEVTVIGYLAASDGTLVPAKGRIDFIGDGGIADLKVTKDGSVEGFQRQVAEYRYHTQAAWYVDLVASVLAGELLPFSAVTVEGSEPHLVNVRPAPEFLLNIGRAEYRGWLDKLLECRKTSKWPGYPNEPLSLPEWELRKTLDGEVAALDLDFESKEA